MHGQNGTLAIVSGEEGCYLWEIFVFIFYEFELVLVLVKHKVPFSIHIGIQINALSMGRYLDPDSIASLWVADICKQVLAMVVELYDGMLIGQLTVLDVHC